MDNDSFTVVDYKSSKVDSAKHIRQVQNYTALVEEATNKKVQGYICYLLEDSIELKKV